MEAKEPPVGFPPTLTALKPLLSMLDDGGKGYSAISHKLTESVSRPTLDPAFSPEISSDIFRSLVLQGTESD